MTNVLSVVSPLSIVRVTISISAMTMTRRQTPESGVLEALCEYLSVRGYFFWRVNNGGTWNGSRFLPLPKWGMKGVSDLIVLYEGRSIFIEAKSDKGTQSPDQKEFQHFVETAGCRYFIARSIDDLTRRI